MPIEKPERPAEETPADPVPDEVEEDENDVEAHGGWGGVGRPDS